MTAMHNPLLTDEELARGRAIRLQVLGDRHVNASHAVDELSQPKTQLSEYVWSKVWARPGLDVKQRSVANLAMLTALNRPHELKLHVKGALVNGVTRDEIREVLLQVAIYCGIPAGIDSFRLAKEAFAELEKAK